MQASGQSSPLSADSTAWGSETLDILLSRNPLRRLDPGQFLVLASAMTHALGELHSQGLFHLDIKPAHFIVGPAAGVRLTGFGASSRSRRERQLPSPPEKLSGTLTHMAPEQTGRMNRSVDARSDLYSLGITFYEMLTGTLPFAASTPMGWVHSHIARQPVPPSERAAEVPEMLDRITLKLLAKNPEDRYQTAAGLEFDLRRCLSEWKLHARIDSFDHAKRDVPDFLLLPEKLYGRSDEIALLNSAFERVVSSGRNEVVLISGGAGIGKSSLVNELHKALVGSHGQFAVGKFDQYKREIPYATLAESFRDLVRQLLSKSDEELASWGAQLLDAMGQDGQLIVDLIPDLALIVGQQAPPPSVEAQEAATRFKRVFLNFVRVFAAPDHPLVLFIDDLQWLDAGTLELIQALASATEPMSLMLIAAYRDNEITSGHPLAPMLAALKSGNARVSELHIAPLQVEHVNELIADALYASVERCAPLGQLVFEKTAGNPFFANQFITELVEENLLTFDRKRSRWSWNIERIHAKRITDNVADLMAVKIGRLSPSTRRAISWHACFGNQGDPSILALALELSNEEIQQALCEAVASGLVLREGSIVKFSHDRVHEAAYGMLSPDERSQAHLRIGRTMLARAQEPAIDDIIFELANQFDRGKDGIQSNAERVSIAQLFLRAGRRAKASGAYASALSHFTSGRTLLDGSDDARGALAFALDLNSAECEIVTADFAAAERRLRALSTYELDMTDEASVVCLAVLLYFTTGRSEQAVEEALRYLATRADIVWNMRPAAAEVRNEYDAMHGNLARRSMAGLAAMPTMTDSKQLAIMAVLTELFPAAYAVDRFLLELVLLRMTNMSLEHGNCESSSVAYSAINMALGSHFSDYQTAYQLGQVACELVERREANRFKARVYSCFAAFTMPWIKHLPECRPLMLQAFQIGSSMGDMAFAAYNLRNLMTHLLMSGVPLPQVQSEAQQAMDFAKRIQLGLPAERFIEQLELVQKLRGLDPQRAADDEWAMGAVEHDPRLAMMVCYHWGFRLQERFLAGDFSAACEAARRIEPIRWAMRSSIEEAEFEFYAALASAALTGATDEQDSRRAELTRRLARLTVWAGTCPENFAARRTLVAAELARIEARELDAQRLYEEALVHARAHGFVQIEALTNELAGNFYFVRGLMTSAHAYLREARECFERWGASVKVRQIDLKYPQLIAPTPSSARHAGLEPQASQFDVEAVDKASQTLSSEMILPSLIEKLMRLALEHAGAQRGLLILMDGERLYVEAEATTLEAGIAVDIKRTAVEQARLPQSALQYVLRTHQRLVLDDASLDTLASSDEYVRLHQPRSVLCLPIFRQSEAIGALYLENNLTTRAFTSGRVAVLDFLASQAAIWLDNARLYSDLRRSEAWLREAQHLSSTGSFYWVVDSDRVEFSEQMYRLYELPLGAPVTIDLIATRFHPDDEHLRLEMIEVARCSGGDLDYVFRARMPDQSVKYLHIVAHASRNKDGKLEYIGAVQDVTQSRLSEEALGKVRSELSHVARVTSLGVLTASIAHEVNQPITGIVTNASTCLRMLSAEPPNISGARETAQRMIRDGRRAAEVITRLRALFSRKREVTESVNLNEATTEVITLAASELRKSGVTVRLTLEERLPHIAGDRVQLQQVILNLLLNAADALRGVNDRPRHVEISTSLEDDNVRLSVRDTGIGIDPVASTRLFEAFYSTKAGGMGIGLSVSRSIVESHHGRIWAIPNDGPGATFAFSLPIMASGHAH